MSERIYITHELIMEKTQHYSLDEYINRDFKKDYDVIYDIKKTPLGSYYSVHGILHLYGYKIAGEDFGFYDAINKKYYSKAYIDGAQIIEYPSETLLIPPKSNKKVRKK